MLPGGIDSHCHIEQLSAAGMMNADTWESATVSAAHGGTTTVIAFAAQHVGMNLTQVVEDYAGLARKGAVVDYAFHMIVADPTEATVREHLPPLIRAGHASLKVFMTYDRLKVDDEPLLDVLVTARENRALVCVHAENHGMISWMGKRLVQRGYTAPKFHAVSHPRARRVRGLQPPHRDGGAPRPAGHDLPRLDGGRRRRRAPGARRRAQGLRRDLPAISVS